MNPSLHPFMIATPPTHPPYAQHANHPPARTQNPPIHHPPASLAHAKYHGQKHGARAS